MEDRDARMRFGLAVRGRRQVAGMTQEGLADAAGLERAYVSALERGKRNPTLLTMHKVAKALGVPLDDLLSDAEEMH